MEEESCQSWMMPILDAAHSQTSFGVDRAARGRPSSPQLRVPAVLGGSGPRHGSEPTSPSLPPPAAQQDTLQACASLSVNSGQVARCSIPQPSDMRAMHGYEQHHRYRPQQPRAAVPWLAVNFLSWVPFGCCGVVVVNNNATAAIAPTTTKLLQP